MSASCANFLGYRDILVFPPDSPNDPNCLPLPISDEGHAFAIWQVVTKCPAGEKTKVRMHQCRVISEEEGWDETRHLRALQAFYISAPPGSLEACPEEIDDQPATLHLIREQLEGVRVKRVDQVKEFCMNGADLFRSCIRPDDSEGKALYGVLRTVTGNVATSHAQTEETKRWTEVKTRWTRTQLWFATQRTRDEVLAYLGLNASVRNVEPRDCIPLPSAEVADGKESCERARTLHANLLAHLNGWKVTVQEIQNLLPENCAGIAPLLNGYPLAWTGRQRLGVHGTRFLHIAYSGETTSTVRTCWLSTETIDAFGLDVLYQTYCKAYASSRAPTYPIWTLPSNREYLIAVTKHACPFLSLCNVEREKSSKFAKTHECCMNIYGCHETQCLERDHIVCRFVGGRDEQSNMQTICRLCHDKKTNSDKAFWEKDLLTLGQFLGICMHAFVLKLIAGEIGSSCISVEQRVAFLRMCGMEVSETCTEEILKNVATCRHACRFTIPPTVKPFVHLESRAKLRETLANMPTANDCKTWVSFLSTLIDDFGFVDAYGGNNDPSLMSWSDLAKCTVRTGFLTGDDPNVWFTASGNRRRECDEKHDFWDK